MFNISATKIKINLLNQLNCITIGIVRHILILRNILFWRKIIGDGMIILIRFQINPNEPEAFQTSRPLDKIYLTNYTQKG